MATKTKGTTHKWQFKARFRQHSFGWKSQSAIQRVKESVAEKAGMAPQTQQRTRALVATESSGERFVPPRSQGAA